MSAFHTQTLPALNAANDAIAICPAERTFA